MTPKGQSRAAAAREDQPATDSEFLLRVCHDLKTCLRSIQPQAELLRKTGASASASEAEKHLSFILDGARRLDLLANGLAGYAIALQINPGTFQIAPMQAVLRGVLTKLDEELRYNNASVSYEDLPRVSGDPDRLGQVFEVLIRNCLVRRGERDPEIHIKVESHTEGWLFSVRDNGPEIEGAYLKRMFQPFERINGQTAADPGLGLATCLIIVERHRGRIWAESQPATGTAFFFILPRSDA